MTKLLALMLFMFIAISVKAVDVKGQIITGKDTMNVMLKIPVNMISQEPAYKKLQNSVRYITENGQKKKLKPDMADEIKFKFGFDTIRMVSVPDPVGGSHNGYFDYYIFLRILVDGKIKLYLHPSSKVSFGPVASISSNFGVGVNTVQYAKIEGGVIYLKKDDEDLKLVANFGRNKMKNYFSDCPELVQKIESKEFKSKDIIQIVQYYNSHCTD
ncbi:hypothetical protein [Marinifilum caeruleilacunae]|uniref:DUF4468 domain-containing protein n=1 Tax=Marinifilum caeruleilacunae TaxID=2499076 RepID=A0ABX1WSQ6_9BACT|nr:hypothetical protein [Marinifilum caeruleilacunae]NOU59142.1 hypothetical protein [Marinifilum caeruleilacunae]